MIGQIINNRYRIIKKVGADRLREFYTAKSITGDASVLVQVLSAGHVSDRFEDIIRFKNECNAVSSINHPYIARVLEIIHDENRIVIIMDYFPGSLLRDVTSQNNGAPLDLNRSVGIVLAIASTLFHLHRAHIIHGFINPFNVLIKSDSINDIKKDAVDIRLVGFGLLYVAKITTKSAMPDENPLGPYLPYIAPEQFRLMTGGHDERSDLYSLGALFYELVTGRPPFIDKAIPKILYQQVAKLPEPPSSFHKGMPAVIDAIIAKLLAKDPDARYQSAMGLIDDLQRLVRGEYSFEPGLGDRIRELNFKIRHIGRESEQEILLQRYSAALDGRGSLCLITGDCGIGKTRLAREFEGRVLNAGGIFLTGYCYSIDNKTPYGPFLEAVDAYIKIFSRYPVEQKNRIRNLVGKATGGLGELLLRLHPAISSLVDRSDSLIKISPEQEMKRLLMIFGGIIRKIAEIEHGIVILIEDTQWIDNASVNLIEELAANISTCPLLLVATCRLPDVSNNHSMRRLMRLKQFDRDEFSLIRLANLDRGQIASLAGSMLGRRSDDSSVIELADAIQVKCGGNPLFCVEFVRSLFDGKIISFDDDGRLVYDSVVVQWHQMPDSVSEMLLNRIPSLDEIEREMLSIAAAIGRRFDLSFLFKIASDRETGLASEGEEARGPQTEKFYADIIAIINKSISINLLEEDRGDPDNLSFSHESIREVFYQNIDPATRRELHLRIAMAIEEIHADQIKNMKFDVSFIFDLAHHYIESGRIDRAFHYSYKAGTVALDNYAYNDSINYYSFALLYLEKPEESLVADNKSAEDYRFEINTIIAGIYLIIGRYDEAVDLYRVVLKGAIGNRDKSAIYKGISEAYFKKGDIITCEKYAATGLKLMGEKLPINRIAVVFSISREIMSHFFGILFTRLPATTPVKKKNYHYSTIIWFYYSLVWSYSQHDTLKYARSVLRMLNISRQHLPDSNELAMSLSFYAILLTMLKLHKGAVSYHHESIELRTRHNDIWGLGQSYQLMGYSFFLNGSMSLARDGFSRSIDIYERIGDRKELLNSLLGKMWISIITGDTNTRLDCAQKIFNIAEAIGDNYFRAYSYFNMGAYERDTGNTMTAIEYFTKALSLSEENEFWNVFCLASIEFGRTCARTNPDRAIKILTRAREIYETKSLLRSELSHLYTELAEAYLYKATSAIPPGVSDRVDYINIIRKTCRMALKLNRPLGITRGNAYRVAALYYAFIGKHKKAFQHFEESANSHRKTGYQGELARTLLHFGIYLNGIGHTDKGKEKLFEAYTIYKAISYAGYAEEARGLLNIMPENAEQTLPLVYAKIKERTRMSSILDFSKMLGDSHDLHTILNNALSISMELSSSNQGYIFLIDEGGSLKMELSKTLDAESRDSLNHEILSCVLDTGRALVVNKDTPAFDVDKIMPGDTGSVMYVPISYDGIVSGVCYLENNLSEGVFTHDEMEAVQAIMSQVSVRITVERLKKNVNKMVDVEPSDEFCDKFQITKREREIIVLLMKGLTRNEISKRLDISGWTTKSHIANIFEKTGVNSKNDLRDMIRAI